MYPLYSNVGPPGFQIFLLITLLEERWLKVITVTKVSHEYKKYILTTFLSLGRFLQVLVAGHRPTEYSLKHWFS